MKRKTITKSDIKQGRSIMKKIQMTDTACRDGRRRDDKNPLEDDQG